MSTPATVPVFSPDGTLGDIPQDQLMAAVKAGAKPGVHITGPDGSPGVIPADRTPDAVKAGAHLVPLQDQPVQHPGFWATLGADLGGLLHPSGLSPYPGMDQDAKSAAAAQASQEDQGRKNAGYSPLYRATVPLAESVGVNVPGMEKSAAEGDVGGVMGHAAAVPTVLAATAGAPAAIDAIKEGGSKALLLGKTPEEAYQSALKPSTTIPPAKVAKMVQTGLQNEIPVSAAGAEKLGSLLDDLHDKVTAEIGAGQGKTIDPMAVAQRAEDLKPRFANQVNPTADLQAIEDSKNEFLANQQTPPASGIGPSNIRPIPADEAQAMKVGTYQQLKGKAYGELKSATIESQKALARGLKEELANQFPELSTLNAQEGSLYDLQPVLEKAIQRQGNHQLLGIGTPIVAGTTKAVTGRTGLAAVAGAIKAVVDNPVVKSHLAIALDKAGVAPGVAQSRIQSYVGGLAASAANAEQNERQSDQSTQ